MGSKIATESMQRASLDTLPYRCGADDKLLFTRFPVASGSTCAQITHLRYILYGCVSGDDPYREGQMAGPKPASNMDKVNTNLNTN